MKKWEEGSKKWEERAVFLNDYRIKHIRFYGVFEFRTRHPPPNSYLWKQIIIIAIRTILFCIYRSTRPIRSSALTFERELSYPSTD